MATSETSIPQHDREPIAALASGVSRSAVAVIRISGDELLPLLTKIVHKKKRSEGSEKAANKPTSEAAKSPASEASEGSEKATKEKWQPRRCYLCRIVDGTEVIDEALVLYFAAPHSYTGQEVVEIHCHGGQYVQRKILARLHANGIRPAAAGEFTKRAFLNAKLDLTAAEGIAQLIAADTETQWRAAQHLAFGALPQHIDSLRTELLQNIELAQCFDRFP